MSYSSAAFSREEMSLCIDGPVGRLAIRCQAGALEGVLASRRLVVVVAHPHPLHGGSMDNKVVASLVRTYRDLGVACVRFNFRGVGESEGQFDQARGEVDDLLAVACWALGQGDFDGLLLAGFSYGSAIAAAASYRIECGHLTLVAPPVERYTFDQHEVFRQPVAVIIGAEDELVDVAGVERWAASRPALHLTILAETGHFFHGRLAQLKLWLNEQLMRESSL